MAKLKPGEFEVEGVVLESLPNLDYRIQITDGPKELVGTEVLAKISGQMKMFRIRVMPGDGVRVLMTPYDKTKGRITYRFKERKPVVMPEPSEHVTEASSPEPVGETIVDQEV